MKASFIPSCAMLALVTGCGQAHIDGIDVRGQVTYQETGAPFPGAKVKVGDKPIATADGEGRFAAIATGAVSAFLKPTVETTFSEA